MNNLTPNDLYTLEAYARERVAFRARVLAHKASRKVHLGAHVTLVFEDRLTIQYQIQEMLRVERIFEAAGIAEELEAYNPLIPDGRNLKATMLIEYPDPDERARKLVELHGIERRASLRVGDDASVIAIADEDLERSTATKTSAVHFLRFELNAAQIAAWRAGARITLALEHPAYAAQIVLDAPTREALAHDFD
ncbi:MAG: DUF3501 family protein [Gammaproteobacteria bacterium]|nr:MAG: DUF3501 family protein [Gammaproteobacteria bacterium]